MAATEKQIISEIVELCGGRNVFADLNELAPAIGIEAVIAANPQAIIFQQDRVGGIALANNPAIGQFGIIPSGWQSADKTSRGRHLAFATDLFFGHRHFVLNDEGFGSERSGTDVAHVRFRVDGRGREEPKERKQTQRQRRPADAVSP